MLPKYHVELSENYSKYCLSTYVFVHWRKVIAHMAIGGGWGRSEWVKFQPYLMQTTCDSRICSKVILITLTWYLYTFLHAQLYDLVGQTMWRASWDAQYHDVCWWRIPIIFWDCYQKEKSEEGINFSKTLRKYMLIFILENLDVSYIISISHKHF